MDKSDVSAELKDKVRSFLSYIEEGLFIGESSRAAGLMLSEVEEIDKLYPKLGLMIQQAEGMVLRRHLEKVTKAQRGWASSRWFLERRFGKNWGAAALGESNKEITPEMAIAQIEYIDAPNINDRLAIEDGGDDE